MDILDTIEDDYSQKYSSTVSKASKSSNNDQYDMLIEESYVAVNHENKFSKKRMHCNKNSQRIVDERLQTDKINLKRNTLSFPTRKGKRQTSPKFLKNKLKRPVFNDYALSDYSFNDQDEDCLVNEKMMCNDTLGEVDPNELEIADITSRKDGGVCSPNKKITSLLENFNNMETKDCIFPNKLGNSNYDGLHYNCNASISKSSSCNTKETFVDSEIKNVRFCKFACFDSQYKSYNEYSMTNLEEQSYQKIIAIDNGTHQKPSQLQLNICEIRERQKNFIAMTAKLNEKLAVNNFWVLGPYSSYKIQPSEIDASIFCPCVSINKFSQNTIIYNDVNSFLSESALNLLKSDKESCLKLLKEEKYVNDDKNQNDQSSSEKDTIMMDTADEFTRKMITVELSQSCTDFKEARAMKSPEPMESQKEILSYPSKIMEQSSNIQHSNIKELSSDYTHHEILIDNNNPITESEYENGTVRSDIMICSDSRIELSNQIPTSIDNSVVYTGVDVETENAETETGDSNMEDISNSDIVKIDESQPLETCKKELTVELSDSGISSSQDSDKFIVHSCFKFFMEKLFDSMLDIDNTLNNIEDLVMNDADYNVNVRLTKKLLRHRKSITDCQKILIEGTEVIDNNSQNVLYLEMNRDSNIAAPKSCPTYTNEKQNSVHSSNFECHPRKVIFNGQTSNEIDCMVDSTTSSQPNPNNSEQPSLNSKETMHKQRRIESIEATIVSRQNISMNDIVGLEGAKQTLSEAVLLPIKYPHLFCGCRQPWTQILLYGPPGTGKTRIVQALASDIDSTFYCISSADLISSFIGESEKLVRELFTHAESQKNKSVVFIDEIDSLCRRRTTKEEDYSRRIKTELLVQMDGACKSQGNVFLICSTNCPWEIDPAFLRRFQQRIYISLPSAPARRLIIRNLLKGSPVQMTNDDWQRIEGLTEGFSGSDLTTVVQKASMAPIRELAVTNYWIKTKQSTFMPSSAAVRSSFMSSVNDLNSSQVQARKIDMQDLISAIMECNKTTSEEDLKQFEKFTAEYGQVG